jgi:hypothetical protein
VEIPIPKYGSAYSRLTKEQQSFAPIGLLGGSGMGCRIITVQYTTLEIEYYSRCPAANASWSNAASS